MFRKTVTVSNNTVGRDLIVTDGDINIITPAPQPVINNLPSKNNYFQGREDYKKKINSTKEKSKERLVVLYGPGGIGKTSIAYEYARSTDYLVKIRIRTETVDLIRADYIQVALLLKIAPEDKTVDQLVDLINQKLVTDYKQGIIIFDNVDNYKNIFNSVRSESVGETLRRFFPKGGNFLVIATTRNKEHWPQESLLPVESLSQQTAFDVFSKISGLGSVSLAEFSKFLYNNKLGLSPLTVCQIASYIRYFKLKNLKEYIDKFAEQKAALAMLSDTKSMPPELTCDGETPEARQAVMTTYNMNIEAIAKRNQSFLELLRYAALMDPDDIGQQELYTAYSKHDPLFAKNEYRREFQQEIEKTSLLTFEDDSVILMHRTIQLVVLFKMGNSKNQIKEIIQKLLIYFGENFLSSRISYRNFTYLLRNIIKKRHFYNAIDMADISVVNGLYSAAKEYVKRNQLDEAILFFSTAIKSISAEASKEKYTKILNKFQKILREHFKIEKINKKWLKGLLEKIDPNGRRTIIDILFEKERVLTRNHDNDFDEYWLTIKNISSAIIEAIKNADNNSKDIEQLAEAHHLLGRTYREKAAKSYTEIVKLQSTVEKIKNTMANITAELDEIPWYQTNNIRKKRERLNEYSGIYQQRNKELNDLNTKFEYQYSKAKDFLSQSVHLKKDNNEKTLIQIIRLDKLKSFLVVNKRLDYAQRILNSQYELTLDDRDYCRAIISQYHIPVTSASQASRAASSLLSSSPSALFHSRNPSTAQGQKTHSQETKQKVVRKNKRMAEDAAIQPSSLPKIQKPSEKNRMV